MSFLVTSTHRATGEVESAISVPTEAEANKLARLTRLAYYGLEVTVTPVIEPAEVSDNIEDFMWRNDL